MSRYLELFSGDFDASVTEKIKPENKPYIGYSIKSGKVIYTIIPKEDMYIAYKLSVEDVIDTQYNMIDLGLPSGALWADRNVGATSPEDFGSYFQWGELEGYKLSSKQEFTAVEVASFLQSLVGDAMEVTKDNVDMILELMGVTGKDLTPMALLEGKPCTWEYYFDTISIDEEGNPTGFTKYNNNSGKLRLDPADDAATYYMGDEFQIPIQEDFEELINNTTPIFIDLEGNEFTKDEVQNGSIEVNNFKGIRFVSNNGNSIFFPAAGVILDGFAAPYSHCQLTQANFITSSESKSNISQYSYNGDLHNIVWGDRCHGVPARGVKK